MALQTDRNIFLFIKMPFELLECPRGVIVKVLYYGIVVNEFELQSRYYVHFRTNTPGKGMNPLIPPVVG